MPTYSFQMSAGLAGSSVSVTAAGSTTVVASGTLDTNAKFTASLPVGDYVAKAADGHYSYSSAGTVAQADPDQLADLNSTFAAAADLLGGVDPATRRTLRDGVLVDPCNSVTPWTRFALNGTTIAVGADVDPLVGRYLRITTGTVSPARIMRSVNLDLSNSFLSFRLRVNDSNITKFEAIVGTRLTNLSQSVQVGGLNLVASELVVGRWNRVTIDLAQGYRAGGLAVKADDNNVVDLGFIMDVNGTAASFDVADIRVHSRANQGGKIIWQFDDASIETYTTAFPILSAAGYVGSIPIEVDKVGTAGRMSVAQLQEVYNAGWELCGHHSLQIPSMTEANQRAAFQAMRDLNKANGWVRGSDFFVWPGGIWSTAAEAVALEYFSNLRRVTAMTPTITPWVTNKYAVPGAYVVSTSDPATVKADMLRTMESNAAKLMVMHRIVPSAATGADTTVANFQDYVNYAKSIGLASTTIDALYGRSRPLG